MRFKGKKKTLFIMYGLINLVFTNLILQTGLFIFPIVYATFLSQLFNFIFGFYLYGRKVFNVKKLNKNQFIKYLLLSILIWNLNWFLITYISFIGFTRNTIALFLVPPLAFLSYVFQRYIVFKN